MMFLRTLALGIAATLYCAAITTADDDTLVKPTKVRTAIASSFSLHQVETNLIDHTNAQRKAHGLPPLKMCRSLMKSARAHSKWMASNNNLSHTHKAVGENIAWGQNVSKEAVSDWMNSSGHRANILSSRYTRIGVAWGRDSNGRFYWCQQFLSGSPK